MQIKVARTVLEHWDRFHHLRMPMDIINLCIKFRGVGEILAVDKTGAFFVANFSLLQNPNNKTTSNHNDLKNITLEWSRNDPIETPKTDHFMIPVNSTLCLTPNGSTLFKIGGGYPIISDMWMYDFTQRGLNDIWNIKIPKMKYARVKCAAVSLNNNNVIVIGGNTSGNKHKQVEMYDIKKEIWCELACTLYPRFGSVAIRINDTKCIVISGDAVNYNNTENGTSEIYDMVTNSWKKVKVSQSSIKMTGDSCFGGVCWNDQIYIVGGWNYPNSAYQFDLHKECWNKLANTNKQHRNSVVGIHYAYSCVFVHGRNSISTEFYDERARCWINTIDSGKQHHPMLQRAHSFQGDIITLL